MNTAVRRLLIIACVVSAVSLSAQTTKKSTTMAPAQPAAVSTDTAQTNADIPKADQAATPPVTADTDKDAENSQAMHLSLDDAIHTMLQKNIGLQIQNYDLLMFGEEVVGAYGVFDPIAGATLNRSKFKTAPTSAFQSNGGGSTDANLSLRDTIPTGGLLSITNSNERFTSTGAGTTLSPGFKANLGFGLTQPLARNFGVDVTRRNITIARNTLGLNQQVFRGVLLDSTSAVEQAYYDLIYTRRFVGVVKDALFLARDQSRITQIRIDVGASAPLDILQPRVQIATSEENLINAVAAVRAAEDRLRALLNVAPEDWNRPIIPTECEHNGHIYYVLLAPGIDRQAVLRKLKHNGIGAVFHYVPLHSAPAGQRFGRADGGLQLTISLSERLIRLPMWLGLNEDQQQWVCDVLGSVLKR